MSRTGAARAAGGRATDTVLLTWPKGKPGTLNPTTLRQGDVLGWNLQRMPDGRMQVIIRFVSPHGYVGRKTVRVEAQKLENILRQYPLKGTPLQRGMMLRKLSRKEQLW